MTTKTKVKDLVFDFLQFETEKGEDIVIDYEASDYFYEDGRVESRHKGVMFNQEDATGRLEELRGAKLFEIGVYSGTHKFADVEIESIRFYDVGGELTFENPYKEMEADAQ